MKEVSRREAHFGGNTPLVCDENGGYTNLVNGQKQPDGTMKVLSPRQVADLLEHSTSQINELYYVKKDTARLSGITEGFEM